MSCIEKLPHSCGTRTGLQVFEADDGSTNGYCFSCQSFVDNPYGEPRMAKDISSPNKKKTDEEIQQEIDEVKDYPVLSVPQKKLKKQYLDEFSIKVGVSEADGKTPQLLCYPYYKKDKLLGYKLKLLPLKEGEKKKIWAIGSIKDSDPFGWNVAIKSGAKRLIITEGEDDAVAVRQIIDEHTSEEYKDRQAAVISLPRGASSAFKCLSAIKKDVERLFKEIVICFDNDEPGQEAVTEAMKVFPSALVADLPEKDANECILQGKKKAAYNALVFNAKPKRNSRLVFGSDLHDIAREEAQFGELTWPYPTLNDLTRGIRYGETYYLGAGVKMGKSELLNDIASHFIESHNAKVFMAKPEEANKKTYKLILNKIAGARFHDPKVEFDYEAYDRAGARAKDYIAMVDLYQHLDWDSLRGDIIDAVGWGAKAVFLDPITNLTNGVNAADANTVLQTVAQDLAAMAKDYGFAAFIFCHLKAHDGNITKEKRHKLYEEGKYIGLGNCPHEFGGDISSAQFAGSRAMMRSCHYMLGLEGNKDESIPEEKRNIRHLVLLEDREFGETGRIPLYWNKHTTKFQET